jgi:cytochrome c553
VKKFANRLYSRCLPMQRPPALLLIAVLAASAAAPLQAQTAPAAPASAAIDTIAERTRACTACHGKDGRATSEGYFPRIAGKPEGYLFNQLLHFRDGRRTNTAMTYLVQHLSDAYLREIAGHFASLDLPYAAPAAGTAAPAALQRGEALALRGDATRQLPACVQCHGAALTGVAPSIPGLLGLPRDYIVGQLGAWRSGQRRAGAPDCMAQVSARLAPEDVGAVAAWLASRPLPPAPKPVAALPQPLPLPCGGFEAAR